MKTRFGAGIVLVLRRVNGLLVEAVELQQRAWVWDARRICSPSGSQQVCDGFEINLRPASGGLSSSSASTRITQRHDGGRGWAVDALSWRPAATTDIYRAAASGAIPE